MILYKTTQALGCFLAISLITSCAKTTGETSLVGDGSRYLYSQKLAEKEIEKKRKILEKEAKQNGELNAMTDKLNISLATLKGEKNKQTVIRDSSTSTEREKQRARTRIEELKREIERQTKILDHQIISS